MNKLNIAITGAKKIGSMVGKAMKSGKPKRGASSSRGKATSRPYGSRDEARAILAPKNPLLRMNDDAKRAFARQNLK